jgi:ADP-ribose pyrophosphatase YjhB (NUDIX family)
MSEDPEHTAIRNLLEEAGVQALEVPEQIGTFSVPNTGKKSTDVLFHKYVMIVRRSNGPLRTDDQMLSEKNLPPIWVRRSLLHEIFEEQPLIEGKVRIHPQRIAYRQFMRQIEMERL